MTEAQKSHLEDGSDPVASVNILVSVLHQSQKSGQFFWAAACRSERGSFTGQPPFNLNWFRIGRRKIKLSLEAVPIHSSWRTGHELDNWTKDLVEYIQNQQNLLINKRSTKRYSVVRKAFQLLEHVWLSVTYNRRLPQTKEYYRSIHIFVLPTKRIM